MITTRVRGTTVSDTDLRILGFPILWASFLEKRLSNLEWKVASREAAVWCQLYNPGFDGMIQPEYMAEVCDKQAQLTRVCVCEGL